MSQEVKRMDPEIKARWVSDLRAGRFEQETSYLAVVSDPDVLEEELEIEGACCLGFLCEIAVDDGVINRELSASSSAFLYGTALTQEDWVNGLNEFEAETLNDTLLPTKVIAWAGLESEDPMVVVIPATMPHVNWGKMGIAHLAPDSTGRLPDTPQKVALSGLNDNGATLDEIANLIEEQL